MKEVEGTLEPSVVAAVVKVVSLVALTAFSVPSTFHSESNDNYEFMLSS